MTLDFVPLNVYEGQILRGEFLFPLSPPTVPVPLLLNDGSLADHLHHGDDMLACKVHILRMLQEVRAVAEPSIAVVLDAVLPRSPARAVQR